MEDFGGRGGGGGSFGRFDRLSGMVRGIKTPRGEAAGGTETGRGVAVVTRETGLPLGGGWYDIDRPTKGLSIVAVELLREKGEHSRISHRKKAKLLRDSRISTHRFAYQRC